MHSTIECFQEINTLFYRQWRSLHIYSCYARHQIKKAEARDIPGSATAWSCLNEVGLSEESLLLNKYLELQLPLTAPPACIYMYFHTCSSMCVEIRKQLRDWFLNSTLWIRMINSSSGSATSDFNCYGISMSQVIQLLNCKLS